MAGIPFPPHDERYDLSEEVMHILKSYWTKERFSFKGKYFQITDGVTAPKPVRKPWPTFYFGGESTAAVKLAGKAADVFLFNGRSLADAKELMAAVNQEAEANDRSIRHGMSSFIVCRDTDEEAQAELARLFSLITEPPKLKRVDRAAQHRKTSGKAGGVGSNGGTATGLVGSPETIAERIMAFSRGGGGVVPAPVPSHVRGDGALRRAGHAPPAPGRESARGGASLTRAHSSDTRAPSPKPFLRNQPWFTSSTRRTFWRER